MNQLINKMPMIVRRALQSVVIWVILVWLRTIKVHHNSPIKAKSLYALWHADLPACMIGFANQGITVQISQSSDGEIASKIAQRLGYRVVRGSSSKGGLSVRVLLKHLCGGRSVGVALDGPKGPRNVAKEGAFWLSQFSRVPQTRLEVRYSKALTLQTWDCMRIPLPFSHVFIEQKNYL